MAYHDEVRSIYAGLEPDIDPTTREPWGKDWCMSLAQEIYRCNHSIRRYPYKRLGRNPRNNQGCYCFRSEDYFGVLHLFDDWGDGPMCVRCGRVYEMDKFDVRAALDSWEG